MTTPTNNNPCILQNVYLAEDDAEDRAIFLDALKEVCKTSKCTTAHDGKDLLDVLNTTVPPRPDVIFLDLNMPNKNGFECLQYIRNSNTLKDTPVVVLTTSNSQVSRDLAYELGANLYFEKPTSYNELKKTLKSVLSTTFSQGLA